MSTVHEIIQVLSEATALRLYNSVASTSEISNRTNSITRQPMQTMQQNSLASIRSSNGFNALCRICRWNRSDIEIVKCPCLCKGSVGFVHLSCLKTWIMHRRNDHCEICNARFGIPDEKLSIRRMMKTFFAHCACPILKHLLFGASLIPLVNIILQQVVICMDNMNLNPEQESLTPKQVFVAITALMTSSALLFHFFEFITTRIILTRNILRHWWAFGNSSDFALIQIDSDLLDLFN